MLERKRAQFCFGSLSALFMASLYHGHSIITPPKNTTGLIGGTAEFQCEVKSAMVMMSFMFNRDKVYEFQNGREEYPKGDDKYLVRRADSQFKLIVKNLGLSDNGVYTCSAGKDEAAASLAVQANAPTIQSSLPDHVLPGMASQIPSTSFPRQYPSSRFDADIIWKVVLGITVPISVVLVAAIIALIIHYNGRNMYAPKEMRYTLAHAEDQHVRGNNQEKPPG